MKKFFFSFIPNLTIAVALSMATILIVDARNPIMGFTSGAPFITIAVALCSLAVISSVALFIKYRTDMKSCSLVAANKSPDTVSGQSESLRKLKVSDGHDSNYGDTGDQSKSYVYEASRSKLQSSSPARQAYNYEEKQVQSSTSSLGSTGQVSSSAQAEGAQDTFNDSFLDDLLNEYDFLR